MPELPEVETTLRGISAYVLHSPIIQVTIRNAQLRWPVPDDLSEQLEQQTINSIRRRAKYLLLNTSTGTLILHLGMSGSLRIVTHNSSYEKHDHVEFCFANGHCLRLKDPRRFGAVLWTNKPINEHRLLSHLGPEPLSKEFNGHYLFQLSRNKKMTIKQFLMNNKIVVGIGNIYASEALFASGIDPRRVAGKISQLRYQKLCLHSKNILQQAILKGGTTLKDFVDATGQAGYFQQHLMVYGRKGKACYQCQKTLQEIKLGGRSTVYCHHCQR
jgi:formamidopyrimidine-DNA glycosylase